MNSSPQAPQLSMPALAPSVSPAPSSSAESATASDLEPFEQSIPGSPRSREHASKGAKFLIVGGLVFLFDAALYNVLVFWNPTVGWGTGLMHSSPISAKILTIAIASCLTYLGNRIWTFGDRGQQNTSKSIIAFIIVNIIASALQLGCLGFSRYILGLDSALADNVSGTFIGQFLSTAFRYVTYGRFVFPKNEQR